MGSSDWSVPKLYITNILPWVILLTRKHVPRDDRLTEIAKCQDRLNWRMKVCIVVENAHICIIVNCVFLFCFSRRHCHFHYHSLVLVNGNVTHTDNGPVVFTVIVADSSAYFVAVIFIYIFPNMVTVILLPLSLSMTLSLSFSLSLSLSLSFCHLNHFHCPCPFHCHVIGFLIVIVSGN